MTQQPQLNSSETLLRTGLVANATFSTLCAWALLLDTHTLSQELGIRPWLIRTLGFLLLGFAAGLVFQARHRPIHLGWALLTSLADFAWVLGSLVFAALWPGLTAFGLWLVLGVAFGVGALGATQLLGIGRLVSESDSSMKTRQRFEIRHVVDAPHAALWAVVADLGAISRFSDDLVESFIRDSAQPGADAVRECANTKGQRWSERCVAFEPMRSLTLEFQTHEDGFPFPMRRMLGGWKLDPQGASATAVTVWWSFTTKPPWAGLPITVLMSHPIRRDLVRVLDRMADEARRKIGGTS